MNDIDELKEHVQVHARSQRVPRVHELLARIDSDESWVREWSAIGEHLERQGKYLEASRRYAMARFPYVDGPARQEALERCVNATDRWRAGRDIERLDIELDGGTVGCWTSGLSTTDKKPLVLVMGGIVTIKEQWAPILALLRRFGMAGIVTELPSAGQNTLRYQRDSWRMLSGILDAVASRADVHQTYAVALSFSGHTAIQCAIEDHRIRGIVTVGAPISEFFTDTAWQQQIPRITVDTLAHMTGSDLSELKDWAIAEARLATVDTPIAYTASLRDSIIPAGETQLLRDNIRHLDLVEIDDDHGMPNHTAEVQLWTASTLLRARDIRTLPAKVINLMLRGRQLRRRVGQSRPR